MPLRTAKGIDPAELYKKILKAFAPQYAAPGEDPAGGGYMPPAELFDQQPQPSWTDKFQLSTTPYAQGGPVGNFMDLAPTVPDPYDPKQQLLFAAGLLGVKGMKGKGKGSLKPDAAKAAPKAPKKPLMPVASRPLSTEEPTLLTPQELVVSNAPKPSSLLTPQVLQMTPKQPPRALTAGEPVRGQTSKELVAMQQAELSPKVLDKIQKVSQQNPTMGEALKYMTPIEAEKALATSSTVQKMSRLLEVLPQAENYSALAKAGQPKEFWYDASSQAIVDLFEQDAPRFTALLAATSPQTSVESNLSNTLNIWRNWVGAGRPTDPRAIMHVMGQSVQGSKGEGSVLDAWVNNAITALSAQDPMAITLSGPKVDSFRRNLLVRVNRRIGAYPVANDAWQANIGGVDQDLFSGSGAREELGDPGYSTGYIANTALIRKGGEQAGMLPLDAQGSIWSVAKTLYEAAIEKGMRPSDFLQAGLLTPQMVRGTVDFGALFKQHEYRRLFDDSYGEKLEKLKQFVWPEAKVNLSLGEQNEVMAGARRLDQLAESRGIESRSKVFPVPEEPNTLPATMFMTQNAEIIPYANSDHFAQLNNPATTLKQREQHTSQIAPKYDNVRGFDRLYDSMDLKSTQRVMGTGLYERQGAPPEVQPMVAIGTEHNVIRNKDGNPDIDPYDRVRLMFAARLKSIINAQGGVAVSGMVPMEDGPGMFVPLADKIAHPAMLAVPGLKTGAIVSDTGKSGAQVFKVGSKGQPKRIGRKQKEKLATTLGNQEYKDAYPVTLYAGNEGKWEQPGKGKITRQLLKEADALTPAHRAAAEKEMETITGDVFKKYQSHQKRTGDPAQRSVMEFLKFASRPEGFNQLRRALRRKEFLPALIPVLFPWYADSESPQQED